MSIFRIYQSLCPMDYHLFTFVTIARRSLEQLLLKPLRHIGTSKLTIELSKRFLSVLVFHYPPLSTPNLDPLPSALLFFLLLKLCHIFFFSFLLLRLSPYSTKEPSCGGVDDLLNLTKNESTTYKLISLKILENISKHLNDLILSTEIFLIYCKILNVVTCSWRA